MGTGYSGNYANTKGSKTINGFPTKNKRWKTG